MNGKRPVGYPAVIVGLTLWGIARAGALPPGGGPAGHIRDPSARPAAAAPRPAPRLTRTFSADAPHSPFSIRLTTSKVNVENVVYAPSNPVPATVSQRATARRGWPSPPAPLVPVNR